MPEARLSASPPGSGYCRRLETVLGFLFFRMIAIAKMLKTKSTTLKSEALQLPSMIARATT